MRHFGREITDPDGQSELVRELLAIEQERGIRISVHAGGGAARVFTPGPDDAADLYIVSWSSPIREVEYRSLTFYTDEDRDLAGVTQYEIMTFPEDHEELDRTYCLRHPEGGDDPYLDGPTFVFAVKDNVLYVGFPFEAPTRLMNHPLLIDDVIPIVREMLGEDLAESRITRSAERFIEIQQNAGHEEVQRLRLNIENHERRITDAQFTIADSTASLRELGGQLAHAQDNMTVYTPEQAREAFERLLSHPKLTSLTLTSRGELRFQTVPLTMSDPIMGNEAIVGAFDCRIKLGSPCSFRFINTTNQRGGRNHPHIPGDGVPCFGNMGNALHELAVARDIIPLIDLTIAVLEGVNVADDWGRYAALWFENADTTTEAEATA